ncbi:MAG: hypothetical protein HY774_06445 [Acidobacteria bacterium]|nr:hypothetical protein [Acidobacteriota bacterium]
MFQRQSGRKPLRTDDPVVCPKRPTTGYCPAPIRAKTDLSATELDKMTGDKMTNG